MTGTMQHEPSESSIGLEDDFRKLHRQINALTKRIVSLEKANNQQKHQDMTTQLKSAEYVQQVEEHNKRAAIAKVIRIVILLLIAAGLFAYELHRYLDPDINKLTQSQVVQIESIPVPYFYIYIGNTMSNLSIAFIESQDSNLTLTKYTINYISAASDSFTYDASVTDWTLLDVSEFNDEEEAFLIPPYDLHIEIGTSLSIFFQNVAYNVWNVPDDTDWDFKEEILLHYANGNDYGLYWYVSSTEDLKNARSTDFMQQKQWYYNKWNQLQYTFVSTINHHYIDLFEEINEIEGTQKLSYTSNLVASAIEESYVYQMQSYSNPAHSYWSYLTELVIYANPKGGGTKTTLTITQKITVPDVLANVGGIFSPISTLTFVLLLWSLFGVHFSFYQWAGFAPYQHLDYEKRLQIKLYLIELGVLNAQQIEKEEKRDAVVHEMANSLQI